MVGEESVAAFTFRDRNVFVSIESIGWIFTVLYFDTSIEEFFYRFDESECLFNTALHGFIAGAD